MCRARRDEDSGQCGQCTVWEVPACFVVLFCSAGQGSDLFLLTISTLRGSFLESIVPSPEITFAPKLMSSFSVDDSRAVRTLPRRGGSENQYKHFTK